MRRGEMDSGLDAAHRSGMTTGKIDRTGKSLKVGHRK
jgi:hypothetical protein